MTDQPKVPAPQRLVSMDAYRGLVMFLKVFWGWKERPFADNIFFKVQKMIDGLKS
jgi:hypothetical protein